MNSEADQLLDQLFRGVTDGVCFADGTGRVIYMNQAALRLLEVSETESRERSICELLCGRLCVPGNGGACLSRCPLRQFASETATFQGRYDLAAAFEGEPPKLVRKPCGRDLRVHCVRIQTTLFDSWELHKTLTIIEDASAEMDLARHKEDWRNMIAHDLRTPLANIFGTLRLIEEAYSGTVFKPEEARIVANSIRASRRMLDLLNLYLDVAKLDAGLMSVRLESLDLGALSRRCVEEQSTTARERGLRVAVSVPAGLKVMADADLLLRVLQNLLGNAQKFAPEGGRVEVSGRRLSSEIVELTVKDNGPGVSQDDAPRLFDRFFQAEAKREGKTRGTGLGLTFCREAVLAMKGNLGAVHPRPGDSVRRDLAFPL